MKKVDLAEVYEAAASMLRAGLSDDFVLQVVKAAPGYDGISGLARLWTEETDAEERDEIIADLQHELEDLAEASSQPQNLRRISLP